MGVVYIAALSAFGHKEWRFLMPPDPIYMIGTAVVFATYGRRLRPLVAPAFAALVAAIFVVCTAAVILVLARGMKLGRKDVRQAYLMLSRLTDVRGVIDDSGGIGCIWEVITICIKRRRSTVTICRRPMSPARASRHSFLPATGSRLPTLRRRMVMSCWRGAAGSRFGEAARIRPKRSSHRATRPMPRFRSMTGQ
jgi:Alg9-like mannosyltransferase family